MALSAPRGYSPVWSRAYGQTPDGQYQFGWCRASGGPVSNGSSILGRERGPGDFPLHLCRNDLSRMGSSSGGGIYVNMEMNFSETAQQAKRPAIPPAGQSLRRFSHHEGEGSNFDERRQGGMLWKMQEGEHQPDARMRSSHEQI